MIFSLRLRFFLTLLFVAILTIVLVLLITNRGIINQFVQYVTRDDHLEKQAIAELLQYQLQKENVATIGPFVEAMGNAYDQQIMLVDANGEILFSTAPESIEEQIVVTDTIDIGTNQTTTTASRQLVLQFAEENTLVEVTDPLNDANQQSFEPETITEGTFVPNNEQRFLGSVNRLFLTTAVAAILLVGIISLSLSRRIIRPVERLTSAARQLEKGDLSQRVKISQRDELGQLGQAFNAMAGGLEQQEHLRRHMVTDIAHELRTPLSNIRGYLEAIQDKIVMPDNSTIDSLYEETLLLSHLIDDLQELSLAEAGQLRLTFSEFAPAPLIFQAVQALQPQTHEKNILLRADIDKTLPIIAADRERTAQVLRNLLQNSLTHTATDGVILVTAVAQATYLEIHVQDNGPGIAAEHLPHIFDRFYRSDKARDRSTGGSGLGLAICKTYIEMQNGRIWATSALNQGTTISFTLPYKTEK